MASPSLTANVRVAPPRSSRPGVWLTVKSAVLTPAVPSVAVKFTSPPSSSLPGVAAEGCSVTVFAVVPPNLTPPPPTLIKPPAATVAVEFTNASLFAVAFAFTVAEAELNVESPSIVTLPSSDTVGDVEIHVAVRDQADPAAWV